MSRGRQHKSLWQTLRLPPHTACQANQVKLLYIYIRIYLNVRPCSEWRLLLVHDWKHWQCSNCWFLDMCCGTRCLQWSIGMCCFQKQHEPTNNANACPRASTFSESARKDKTSVQTQNFDRQEWNLRVWWADGDSTDTNTCQATISYRKGVI